MLVPSVIGGPTSHVDGFRIGAAGGLTPIGSASAGVGSAVGASGLAAR